jgi:hypothetical protein
VAIGAWGQPKTSPNEPLAAGYVLLLALAQPMPYASRRAASRGWNRGQRVLERQPKTE